MATSRIGWVIGDQLERRSWFPRESLFNGGTPLVRYRWMVEWLRLSGSTAPTHEVYRPWRRYDALIFLKSMGEAAVRLAERYRERKRPVLFDANVAYYDTTGNAYYRDMLPTPLQQRQAIAMTAGVDAVIADSSYIAGHCRRYNPRVEWIPDSVRMDLVPDYRPTVYRQGRLRLLWSGQIFKLVDLLAIEGVLRKFAARIELVVVSNDRSGLSRILDAYRGRLQGLLGSLEVRFIDYRDPLQLFDVYGGGGVLISPRFLDSAYNLGHTEWKITLGMACGRCVLCSPVPSYVDVERLAEGGIRVCADDGQWESALEESLCGRFDREAEEHAARAVVAQHYATAAVAARHARFVAQVMDGDG